MKTKRTKEQQLKRLETLVLAHRYLYYVCNTPVISDLEYDILEKQAMKLLPESSQVFRPGSDLESSYTQEVKDKASELSQPWYDKKSI